MLAWTCAGYFGEGAESNAHQLAVFAFFGLLEQQFFITNALECHIHGVFVIATVVNKIKRRLIRKLLFLDKVLAAQFDGIYF